MYGAQLVKKTLTHRATQAYLDNKIFSLKKMHLPFFLSFEGKCGSNRGIAQPICLPTITLTLPSCWLGNHLHLFLLGNILYPFNFTLPANHLHLFYWGVILYPFKTKYTFAKYLRNIHL